MVNAERILETERVGAVDVEKMRERQTDNDVDELPARSARGMWDHQTGNESDSRSSVHVNLQTL